MESHKSASYRNDFWRLLKESNARFAELREKPEPLKEILGELRINPYPKEWLAQLTRELYEELLSAKGVGRVWLKNLTPAKEPEVFGTLCLLTGLSALRPQGKLAKYGLLSASAALLVLRGLRGGSNKSPDDFWETRIVFDCSEAKKRLLPAFACEVYDKIKFAFPDAKILLRAYPTGHCLLDVSYRRELCTVLAWDQGGNLLAPREDTGIV